VIRKAVLHMIGEQPLVIDLEKLPEPGDSVLVCMNVRTFAGQRPTFVDAIDSTLVIPYHNVRFVEVPVEALGTRLPAGDEAVGRPSSDPELRVDEDFLRRVREA
jgi:hypothetical protein